MEFKKLKLPLKIKNPVLALGSHTKNTVCFLNDGLALISPVHQDLNQAQDYFVFEKTVRYFLRKRPKIIAHDLHPGYQSTKIISSQFVKTDFKLQAIQHHHAHIASCMIEHGLKNQRVIGVAFDGTGLGPDNTLWGAEFIVSDYQGFMRRAHLKAIPLLGAEQAILEPWRLSAAWLYLLYQDRFLNLDIGWSRKIQKEKWRALQSMYKADFNSPLASSMGRLFDAAASLILEKDRAHFEAELAIELEKLATEYKLPDSSIGRQIGYEFALHKDKEGYSINPLPLFKAIVDDLKARLPKEKIAYKFHLAVSLMIKEVCVRLKKETKINKVVLSGGVFQNQLLLRLSLDLLNKGKFLVFTHKQIPCNDAGISLGQALITHFRN